MYFDFFSSSLLNDRTTSNTSIFFHLCGLCVKIDGFDVLLKCVVGVVEVRCSISVSQTNKQTFVLFKNQSA